MNNLSYTQTKHTKEQLLRQLFDVNHNNLLQIQEINSIAKTSELDTFHSITKESVDLQISLINFYENIFGLCSDEYEQEIKSPFFEASYATKDEGSNLVQSNQQVITGMIGSNRIIKVIKS